MTDKYTRTFADFNNHPWPGKILPEYFENIHNAGDGNMGLQAMMQGAMSAYGPYHVIEGCEYVAPGVATEWTGTVGFVMYSGLIREVPAASGALSNPGEYLIYNSDGSFGVTGAKPTGVILAQNIGGGVYTTNTRWDSQSRIWFPNTVTIFGKTSIKQNLTTSGDINLTGDIDSYGNISSRYPYAISGYETITADTGQFKHITGFSNVYVDSHLDFHDSYNISGVVQLSGSLVRVDTAGGLTVGTRTLTDGEWQQLTNIGANAISNAEWGYLGNMNQDVDSDADPTFDTLTLDAAGLTVGARTLTDPEWEQLTNIGANVIPVAQWIKVTGMQNVAATAGPTFSALTISTPNGVTVGSNTPSALQWGYVATLQNLATSANPVFATLTLNAGGLTVGSHVLGDTEWAELAKIGSTSISAGQWVYLGNMNQDVITTSNVTFNQMILNGTLAMGGNAITTSSTVDGVDVSSLNTNYTNHAASNDGGHAYVGQDLRVSFSPTFGGLSLNGNLVMGSDDITFSAGGTVDGVDVSALDSTVSSHNSNTSNPHTVTLDQAFDENKIIDGANIEGNAFQVGNWKLWDYNIKIAGAANIYGQSMYIGTSSTNSIYFEINDNPAWEVDSSRHLFPSVAQVINMGSPTKEIQYFYSCNAIQDTTCADFSNFEADKLYDMFAQIKPMDDGGLHYEKTIDEYYPHVDFKTLPREFIHPTEEAYDKDNAVYELNDKGEHIGRNIHYEIGDCVAINTGPYMYALKDLVVKSYEKIKQLEEEIKLLKNN